MKKQLTEKLIDLMIGEKYSEAKIVLSKLLENAIAQHIRSVLQETK